MAGSQSLRRFYRWSAGLRSGSGATVGPRRKGAVMVGKVGNIVFYAERPQALAAFWSAVLGYPETRFEGALRQQLLDSGLTEQDLARRGLAEDPEGVGARLFFQPADGPKSGRNRVHVDIQATPGRQPTEAELDAEMTRVLALGATLVRLVDQDWGVFHERYYQLQDPEGNEFCLQ